MLTVAAPARAPTRFARWHTLPRDSRDTLFLLAVVGWLLLPQFARLPLWTSVLAAGVLAWRGWLAWHARPLPGRWWLTALLVLALAGTLYSHRTVLGRDAGVTLMVVLLALKTLELRARRDAFVIFFLGFFAMLTNFFFSQSLVTAAVMLVGLLGLLTALVNAHMPVGKPPLAAAARQAGWMALLGAPIMALLFVLFPRMAPLWGQPGEAPTGRSGLSASMEIGNIAQLALDDSIAMRIRFGSPQGEPPPQRELYFRGPVLSTFDGREWQPLGAGRGGSFSARWQTPAALEVRGTPVAYEVTLEATQRPWLMVLDAAVERPQLPGYDVAMAQDLQWLTSRPIADLVRYRAVSHPNFTHGPLARTPNLGAYTELPDGFDPRTRALAAELRSRASGSTEALVAATLERLRTGGYVYTLEPGVYGRDSADEFWFDRKEGFCEHIASAFVVLMRAADVPARIVTGYQGGERNPVDGFWTVRQSDAHAWTEVWIAGRGWVRVDPTSAVAPGRTGAFQRLTPRPGAFASAFGNVVSPGFVAQIRAGWEAVNNRWNQWVLNYSQSSQLDLLRALGFSSPGWEDLGLLLAGLLVAAALGGAGWALWERSQHDPWLRLLQRTRLRLAKCGVAGLGPATPPRAMADAVQHQFGDAARPLADWLRRLDALRYARNPAATLAQLQREGRQLTWPG